MSNSTVASFFDSSLCVCGSLYVLIHKLHAGYQTAGKKYLVSVWKKGDDFK